MGGPRSATPRRYPFFRVQVDPAREVATPSYAIDRLRNPNGGHRYGRDRASRPRPWRGRGLALGSVPDPALVVEARYRGGSPSSRRSYGPGECENVAHTSTATMANQPAPSIAAGRPAAVAVRWWMGICDPDSLSAQARSRSPHVAGCPRNPTRWTIDARLGFFAGWEGCEGGELDRGFEVGGLGRCRSGTRCGCRRARWSLRHGKSINLGRARRRSRRRLSQLVASARLLLNVL